jgi:hypothetical protein
LKITIFDLHFDVDSYYIKRDSIVDKITFNNRTLYSKYEKIAIFPTQLLINQHLNGELIVAVPLISNKTTNYIVIEYEKESSNRFYYLLKQILKSLYIETFYTYKSSKKNHVQIFIPFENFTLEQAYEIIEKIEYTIEFKANKRCKILPHKHFPEIYNKITLPIKKM